MPYEDQQAQGIQAPVDGSQAQTQEEPVDIAQAFSLINQGNKQPAQDDVDAGEPGEASQETGDGFGGAEDNGDATGRDDAQVQAPTQQQVPTGVDDQPADSMPGFDYGAAEQQLMQQLQRQAMMETYDMFQKNGIKSQWSIGDLYERDEQSGRVRFRNPDVNDDRDPDAYFRTRKEADDWVNSMNAQINQQFRQEVGKKIGELRKEALPRVQLMRFANTYERLDDMTRNILEDLVEDYAIVKDGQVIGFNCDLNRALEQARRISSRYAGQQQQTQTQQQAQQPQAQQQANEPAMDMQTSGGSGPVDSEPKDINEAMEMLNKQRREERKKKNGK